MLFRSASEVTACGMFSIEHFILLAITIICIVVALKETKNIEKNEVRNIIKKMTIILWILEIIKIIFNIINYGPREVNKYIPLYFCSLILYAGIFSGFCKGKLKRTGDVFLATGGIIAGIVFLLYPLTSLTIYPAIHYISMHSFILHGTMVYLGLLMIITNYVKIDKKDIIYYCSLIVTISAIAYIVNIIFNSNLMFISQNYPGTYIELIYKSTGKLFPIFMIAVQATLPFYIVYGLSKLFSSKTIYDIELNDKEKSNEKEEIYSH